MPVNILGIVVGICVLMAFNQVVVGQVEIQDNGYTGLKIAIHRNVEENPNLLKVLQEILKRSSKLLYESTKKRAYFKEITIIVPPTWSSKPEYTKDESEECLKCAEIRIAPARPQTGNIPYTYQPGGCGEQGKFIHFTPDFILKNISINYPKPSKHGCVQCKKKAQIFIHEWSHLRYGVFNEDGHKKHKFYKSKNQGVKVIGCSQRLYGRLLRTGANNNEKCPIDKNGNVGECIFSPDMTSGVNNRSKVSLMYLPELDVEYTGLCGDDDDNGTGLKHNSEAPNKQNKMCNGRSVLNVTFENEDFKYGRNPPRKIEKLEPKINIIHKTTGSRKNSSTPFILVLDTSTSMKGRPIEYLTMAVTRFIRHIARSHCPIGMASFAFHSRVLTSLTTLTDESREELVKKIPSILEPATAIGKGILKAIEMLRLPNGKTQKGNLILISDGEENVRPLIDTIKDKIKESGVTIYSVAFGMEASSKLEEITTLTGGKGWQFKLDEVSKSLDSILNEIDLACGGEEEEDLRPFINKNGAFHLEKDKKIEGSCIIDKTQGSSPEVTILFSYDFLKQNEGTEPNIILCSPSGIEYKPGSKECTLDKTSHTIRCRFLDTEDGNWTFVIQNGPDPVNVNLMITSDIIYEKGSNPNDVRPIRIDSWISAGKVDFPKIPKIYAKVEKDSKPVLRAKVVSTLYRPNGDSIAIQLMDNGQDPDVDADDGTYTAYITKFLGNGRYAIDTAVMNDGDARLLENNVPGSKAPMLPSLSLGKEYGEAKLDFIANDFEEVDYIIDNEETINYDLLQPAEAFERFVTGGTFMLSNWEEESDLIPPSRVTDLTARVINRVGRIMQLQWFSPGDDMNDGQATSVDIRYHQDLTLLTHSFEKTFNNFTIIEGSLQPPQPHETHSITLQLPTEIDLEKIHFAVRVFDEAQNAGDVSNPTFTEFASLKEKIRVERDWTMYFVIGGLLIFAVVVIIIILGYKNHQRIRQTMKQPILTEKSQDSQNV